MLARALPAVTGTASMQFNFSHDLEALKRRIGDTAARQIPYAASTAINRIAAGLRGEEMALMPAELDRPTPFTMRGVKYTRSSKRDLTASVYLDEIQSAYLGWQIEGGKRTPKKKALVVPASAMKLNSYGNMAKGKVQKMLADKKHYFSGKPRGGDRPAGIWKREGKGGKIVPQVLYEPSATYKPKVFDFYGHGKRFVDRRWAQEMNRAIEEALRSAR